MELREEREENLSTSVDQLLLKNFRNYPELDIHLGSRFNVVSGPNGQGKTNLLEALHLVSTTRLLRGQREVEAIRDGQEAAEVTVELSPNRTQVSYVLERGARKRVLLNGMKLPRASDVLGRLSSVCISTEDMEIVRGEPATRRLFLDLELSARSAAYLRHFTVYKRALEQRNALIKQARESYVSPELWEVWEEQLAQHGAAIRELRRDFVDLVRGELPDIHRQIGGGENAGVETLEKAEQLSPSLFANTRGQDIARGSTTIGPHRDDVELTVNGKSARLFGSQGQQRTFVIALKLATLLLGKQMRGEPPLLLLDDIFSDLDLQRRSSLVEIVLELAGQTVLTCTEPELAGPKILSEADLFRVVAGAIRKS